MSELKIRNISKYIKCNPISWSEKHAYSHISAWVCLVSAAPWWWAPRWPRAARWSRPRSRGPARCTPAGRPPPRGSRGCSGARSPPLLHPKLGAGLLHCHPHPSNSVLLTASDSKIVLDILTFVFWTLLFSSNVQKRIWQDLHLWRLLGSWCS